MSDVELSSDESQQDLGLVGEIRKRHNKKMNSRGSSSRSETSAAPIERRAIVIPKSRTVDDMKKKLEGGIEDNYERGGGAAVPTAAAKAEQAVRRSWPKHGKIPGKQKPVKTPAGNGDGDGSGGGGGGGGGARSKVPFSPMNDMPRFIALSATAGAAVGSTVDGAATGDGTTTINNAMSVEALPGSSRRRRRSASPGSGSESTDGGGDEGGVGDTAKAGRGVMTQNWEISSETTSVSGRQSASVSASALLLPPTANPTSNRKSSTSLVSTPAPLPTASSSKSGSGHGRSKSFVSQAIANLSKNNENKRSSNGDQSGPGGSGPGSSSSGIGSGSGPRHWVRSGSGDTATGFVSFAE